MLRSTKSMSATIFSPSMTGQQVGQTEMPKTSRSCSTVLKKSAFSTSIEPTKNILDRPALLAYSNPFSVPTPGPPLPDTTSSAVSATRTPCITSPTKSRYPGVSRKLILCPLYSTGATAVEIEI